VKSSTLPERRTTAVDVAREAGVSRATVGFVLNRTAGQTISEATQRRVHAAAEKLGYRPRAAAQALASGRSHLVMLVLPNWPVGYSVRQYIEESSLVLDEAGYALVTYTPHETGKTRPLWELLDPDIVVGLAPFTDAQIASMKAHGVPHVISDPEASRDYPGAAGPARQVDHLHAQGHRRLAIATSADPRLADIASDRAERAIRRSQQLALPRPDVWQVDAGFGTYCRPVFEQWKSTGVTGIVAYNDEIAALVMGAALRAGLKIPQDFAVIGHDDSPLASLFVPSITSIRLNGRALGHLLAELALERVEGRPLAESNLAKWGSFEEVAARDSTSVTA